MSDLDYSSHSKEYREIVAEFTALFVMGQAAANNTVTAENGGICIGFATAAGQSGNSQQIMAGTSVDHSTVTMDTDGWCRSDDFIGMVALAGAATLETRANVESWGTNQFTMRWNAAGSVARRFIYMSIKGGNWQAGEYLHNGSSASNTVNVTGFSVPVKGIEFITAARTENNLNAATANGTLAYGYANSTTNRATISIHDRDGTADSWCRNTMNTASILSYSLGSSAFIYFGNREWIAHVGLKPSWKKALKSGGLDGRLVKYEIY